MYCHSCRSAYCIHTGHGLQNMAAQQQMSQQAYLAMFQDQMSRVMSEEMIKAYKEPKKNKKLLLLRK